MLRNYLFFDAPVGLLVTLDRRLSTGSFTPVTKTLLWQGYFGFSNFEGMTLGPKTGDGVYSLLLIADDGAGELAQRQDVLSLILSGVGGPAGPLTPPSLLV
jgi:hypothetical protein